MPPASTKSSTRPPGSYTRGSVKLFPTMVNKSEETNFRAWAKSFGPEVAEVLLSADGPGWECQPARECYCRVGWWKGMPAKYVLGWWMSSLRHLEETECWDALEVYEAAIEAIKRAL